MNIINKLYNDNINIMEFFRELNKTSDNSTDAIKYSYDVQSGSYIKGYLSDNIINALHNNKIESMYLSEFRKLLSFYIMKVLKNLNFSSFLDAGTGESTTLHSILNNDKDFWNKKSIYATDISLSRLLYANSFIKEQFNNFFEINYFTSNIFELPIISSSIDVVFTSHSIEPNTNKEKEILQELYRVAGKYIVLLEPSYNLGNQQTKENIEKHKYIKNLYQTAKELGYKIIDYRLFEINSLTNNHEIIVIEKDNNQNITDDNSKFACPVCKNKLEYHNNNYFCKECSLIYPVINNIPIFNKEYGILCSKFMEF